MADSKDVLQLGLSEFFRVADERSEGLAARPPLIAACT